MITSNNNKVADHLQRTFSIKYFCLGKFNMQTEVLGAHPCGEEGDKRASNDNMAGGCVTRSTNDVEHS